MDVYFVLNGITFVWDNEKARINPQNHEGERFSNLLKPSLTRFLWCLMQAVMMKREMPLLGWTDVGTFYTSSILSVKTT